MPMLPVRPSGEHLRKLAKRLAHERSLRLADAQMLLANRYGFRTWAELMNHVASVRGEQNESPLFAAVKARNVAEVRRLIAEGANPRVGDGRESPLHTAARLGPLALVEALIVGGALEWDTDEAGRTPLDVARRSRPRDRAAVIALLDRSAIVDDAFRAAVEAIHAGDVRGLERLLDEEPRLLRDRISGPEAYRLANRHQYFLDPKLFWFIANNPTAVDRMPANIVDVARLMIDRGVDKADLDYTLELTISSSVAREQGHQLSLIRELLSAGATPTRDAMIVAAAYREIEALRALVAAGQRVNAPIAAALGDDARLRDAIAVAGAADVQAAFGLAIINGHIEAARIAVDAGADVNARLPVHAHATALHQAAGDEHPLLVEWLLARGARADVRDTLWNATPLQWAVHQNRPLARAVLERVR